MRAQIISLDLFIGHYLEFDPAVHKACFRKNVPGYCSPREYPMVSNRLYHNNRDGTFTNVAKEVGVGIDNHAVGAVWGDYDNDGYLDLYVTSYHGPRDQQQPRDSLFHNEAGKGFRQVLTETSQLNVGDHGVQ